ncbi:mammalian cell entry protein [Mycolicibacterium conceptionense]|jgi:virulence factor Mce-like protein|uniref:Mammalian cell entry protein n=2 Tax=Mycolicibacterium TaxID=1866885 RepID=A0A0J8U383_9MYCO|nr:MULTISPECIES: MCE family protein [Mycolicibacterium]KLI05062.1 mammalian cell entry protein [Mycolicibacterium senegalense]KLO51995.1 mammalian cell entry protein [Mycolicibacterium senegalense]KMV15642.1 mammalian cell entry protein [Mycolicibacterium conceptionense]MCW1822558.1 MCE family protein [Mycolicibacterium senegalense]OBB09705.1 mammalian cell entry protein [Mycolicibacterium conceptionense]
MRPWFKSRILAVVVVGGVLVAGVAGASWWYLRDRDDAITVTAQFDSAAGLYDGNTVAVLGMQVGRVTRIVPKGNYVEVEFTVDKDVSVPADAQAVTISNSILTDRQIELTPPYRGGPKLQNHDTIGLSRTKTPVEFARVLDVLDKLSSSLKGDGKGSGPIADVVNSSAAIADGNGQQMKDALGELSDALRLSSDRGAVTRDQLTTIVRNLSSLFDAAARNDTTLREFGSSVRQLSQILADENFGSGTTGKKINDVINQVGEVLQTHREEVKQIVLNGNTALTTTVDHKRDLQEFLDLTPMTLDNLYNIVDQKNGAARVHLLLDKVLVDSQTVKEVCNMMGLRQLGCSTGTVQDFGPDFGLSYMLDGMAAMGQR